MNDLILVKNIQEGIKVEFSLDRLASLHSNIYYKMVNSYIADSNTSLKEELFGECKYHIFYAAKEYDFDKKSKFSTYLANKTKWMCLNINTKNKRVLSNLDLMYKSTVNAPIESNPIDLKNMINQEVLRKVFSMAKIDSDSRIEKIFNLRYVEGEKNKVMPWKNVCKHVGMSIQGCINIHNNFINKIKEGLINDK